MLRVGEPTPRPEVPIEGAEMIFPLICIGIFFLVMLGLFAWFFYFMHCSDAKSQVKQEKMYKSYFVKHFGGGYSIRYGGPGAPKRWGKWWK